MTLPTPTPESQAAGLAAAKEARQVRAGIEFELKHGKTTLSEVLAESDSVKVVARRMKVHKLLTSLPGVGSVTAEEAMGSIGIAPSRRLGGLGSAQRAALIARFG